MNALTDLLVVLRLAAWVAAFCAGAALYAAARQRNAVIWGVYGVILGPIAILLLAWSPSGRCVRCGASARDWSARCHLCGFGVGPDATEAYLGEAYESVTYPTTAPAARHAAGATVAPVSSAAPSASPAPAASSAAGRSSATGRTTAGRRSPATAAASAATPPTASAARSPAAASGATSPATTAASRRPARTTVKSGPETGPAPRRRRASASAPVTATAVPPPAAPPKAARTRRPSPGPVSQPWQTAAVAAAPTHETLRVLATAVYSGGSQPLTIGLRYILAIDGNDFEVRGPVDRDPNATVFAHPLRSLEGVGMGDRFVVTVRGGSTRSGAMGFTNVMGDTGENLERVLAAEQATRAGQGDGRS
jgi:hypothetical protein